ncbi:MAG: hypothetical protein EB060_09430 [Proteobacteria bacterium]|nr:hypothetical protein [Pseudomonadota bacterium]
MNRRIGLFGALFLIWILYSGLFATFFILGGIVSAAVVVWLTERMGIMPKHSPLTYIRPQALRYYLWLLKEMVLSAKDVSFRVWGGCKNISPTLGWMALSQRSEGAKTVLANSITLTPGTVTTGLQGKQVQVHAISKEGFASLAEGAMDRNVTKATEGT